MGIHRFRSFHINNPIITFEELTLKVYFRVIVS
jgi:hypothetical protein